MKRNTFILLLLAALLGAGVYFYESRYGTERDAEPDTSVAAFTFKADEIAAITLTNEGKTVLAEKANDKWTISQPLVTEGDQSGLNQIAEDIAGVKLKDLKPATPENLKEFGLAEPKTIAELKLKNGQTHRLAFGDKSFTGSDVYVRADQMDKVGIIAVPMLLLAQKSLNDLRDRHILNLQTDDVTRFRLKNPNLTLVAEKSADGKWLAVEPVSKKGKEVIESQALGSWLTTIAQEVIDSPSDEIKAKAAKTEVEAEVTAKDGQTYRLKVSAADGEDSYVSVAGREKIYRIRKSELEGMIFKTDDVIPEPTPTPNPTAAAPPADLQLPKAPPAGN